MIANNTSPAVRTIDVFREATGPFAVQIERAHDITAGVRENISPYVAPLEFDHIAGLKIPTDQDPIAIRSVNMPRSRPHTLLLTGRAVLTAHGTVRESGDYVIQNNALGVTVGSKSRIVVASEAHDPANEKAVASGVHTVAHTLGVGHCATRGCIMWGDAAASPEYMAAVNRTGQLFCAPHVGQLKVGAAIDNVSNLIANVFRS